MIVDPETFLWGINEEAPWVDAAMPRYALATDYDGTLANRGAVSPETLKALTRFRQAGGQLILITGRELDELLGVFPDVGIFHVVVAENGALLYRPSSGSVKALAEGPPDSFANTLIARGVTPLSRGRVVVATWQPHEQVVRKTIQEQALDLEVILNKRAIMVLPKGINKGSGLLAAAQELGLRTDQIIGVGDAENDLDFLALCKRAVAVSNALSSVKERCGQVTEASHGAGVVELLEGLEDEQAF